MFKEAFGDESDPDCAQVNKVVRAALEAMKAAGAEVVEDLRGCDCILGVKQPSAESVIPGSTYAFFSHTIKAQAENMALLDALAENGCTRPRCPRATSPATCVGVRGDRRSQIP